MNLTSKSISAEFLLQVTRHICYFFALGGVGAAVVLVVVKALPAWVAGWLWGVTHGYDGGLYSWECVHAALACYFMPHGPQLKLVIVWHPHKRAPAENTFKAGPKPEHRQKHVQNKMKNWTNLWGKTQYYLYIYAWSDFFHLWLQFHVGCNYKFLTVCLRWKQAFIRITMKKKSLQMAKSH